MTALTDKREELALALEVGDVYSVARTVPEALEPPVIVLQPAPEYIADGDTFDRTEFLMSLEVYLIVELESNEQAAEELDSMLEHFLACLPSDWWLTSIAQPGPLHTAEWVAHGMPLTVQTNVHIT